MPDEVKPAESAMDKYFKPTSLTWWAAVFPLVGGLLLMISKIIPGLEDVAAAVNTFWPGADGVVLINIGLAGIGLRGAMQKNA